jgi:histone H3/H4
MDESLYAHLHQPILKILHSYGITKASSISVQVLSSVLDKYLASLVASCQDYANHAGRTSLRVNDVMESLEEMGTLLDDLKDYLEQEGGVTRTKDGPTVPVQDQSALSRYANVTGPRKEAELNEFKGENITILQVPSSKCILCKDNTNQLKTSYPG